MGSREQLPRFCSRELEEHLTLTTKGLKARLTKGTGELEILRKQHKSCSFSEGHSLHLDAPGLGRNRFSRREAGKPSSQSDLKAEALKVKVTQLNYFILCLKRNNN